MSFAKVSRDKVREWAKAGNKVANDAGAYRKGGEATRRMWEAKRAAKNLAEVQDSTR